MIPFVLNPLPAALRAAVCGLVILSGLAATGVGRAAGPTQEAVHATSVDVALPPDAAQVDSVGATEVDESVGEQLLESAIEILILGPILVLCLALLFAIPSTILGVSLVMDGGCLRYFLFLLGWLFAVIYGFIFGAVVADMVLGIDALTEPLAQVFIWGYPFAAWWAHRRLESMPREEYSAWEQSLTGGALLGFGAGSVASLVRSAAGGFGGFGGGSFGGGGASGTWSGSAGTAASTSSATAATAGSSGAGATAAGTAVGAGGNVDNPSDTSKWRGALSRVRSILLRFNRWADKFEWYHGLIFALVTLVFLPLGLGAVHALQNTKVLIFVLAATVLYTGYRLFRRMAETQGSTSQSTRARGEASSTWT